MRGLTVVTLGLLVGQSTALLAVSQSPEPDVSRPSRLVRSQASITSGAFVQADTNAKLSEHYPFKPRVIQVFYEALCPDSARLMADKSTGLWSSFNSQKARWRFDLYPFGNARRDHWNNVVCQHGNEECKGNVMHQCALKVLKTEEAFALIDCLMSTVHEKLPAQADTLPESTLPESSQVQVNSSWVYDDTDSSQAPTQTHGITDFKTQVAYPCWRKLHQPRWQKLVEDCTNDGETRDGVQNYYETETKRVNFTWVPAVFLNGTFSYKASHSKDLLSYLD